MNMLDVFNFFSKHKEIRNTSVELNSEKPEKILEKGTLNQIKELLKNKIEFKNGLCPLHYAVANKDSEIIIYLLNEKKMDIDSLSNCRTTPLHRAAFYGNIEAMRILIENGADPGLKNKYGQDIISILEYGENGKHRFLLPEVKKIIQSYYETKGSEKRNNPDENNYLRHRKAFIENQEEECLLESINDNSLKKKFL